MTRDFGGIINEFHTNRIGEYLKDHGGNSLINNEELKSVDPVKRHFPPTIIENPSLDSKVMTEEIFGPILPIRSFSNIDEAIKFVTDRPKPLACYYFGGHFSSNAKKIENYISSGGMVINDTLLHVVNPELPFGGVGHSGYGKYHGKLGFQAMSNPKSILTKGPSNFYPYNIFAYPFT